MPRQLARDLAIAGPSAASVTAPLGPKVADDEQVIVKAAPAQQLLLPQWWHAQGDVWLCYFDRVSGRQRPLPLSGLSESRPKVPFARAKKTTKLFCDFEVSRHPKRVIGLISHL